MKKKQVVTFGAQLKLPIETIMNLVVDVSIIFRSSFFRYLSIATIYSLLVFPLFPGTLKISIL
jgi:hypothetical protein